MINANGEGLVARACVGSGRRAQLSVIRHTYHGSLTHNHRQPYRRNVRGFRVRTLVFVFLKSVVRVLVVVLIFFWGGGGAGERERGPWVHSVGSAMRFKGGCGTHSARIRALAT